MRLAITTTGKDLDSEMDPRFGRAQYILITDPQGKMIEVIDNSPSREAMGGAGITAAKTLADRKVDVLLTGRCGPNAVTALRSAGIKIYEIVSSTARQALESFNSGEIGIPIDEGPSSAPLALGIQDVPERGMVPDKGIVGRGMGTGRGKGRCGGAGRIRRRG